MCASPNEIRKIGSSRMEWAGNVLRMGTKRNTYRILVGKPQENIPLRRLGRTLEDNIKIYLREIEWGGMDWIEANGSRF